MVMTEPSMIEPIHGWSGWSGGSAVTASSQPVTLTGTRGTVCIALITVHCLGPFKRL